MAPLYYRDADGKNQSFFDILLGAIIVYDTTNKQTFKKVQIWIEELKEHSNNSNIVIIIAGN